jgi:hypothetical protein
MNSGNTLLHAKSTVAVLTCLPEIHNDETQIRPDAFGRQFD